MGKIEDTIEERENWHWRNSMRPVRFFSMDARAAIPFMALLVYFRVVTLIVALLSTIIFMAFEKRGLTYPCALRNFRSWFIGPTRPAWISIRRRRLIDYR